MAPTFPLSIVNLLGDPLRKPLIRIDADRVVKLAERLTGLHDYGDSDGSFRGRLNETIDAVLETDWNTVGRFGIRYILHWHLSNRLRLVELLKQRPDIEDIDIVRPLVITGLFRTGTTYLHNVLAADPSSRVGRMWEFAHPVGRSRDLLGDGKWRRWRAGHEVAMDDVMIPEQAVAHKVTVEAYEEDFFLLENDMAVLTFWVGFAAYSYANEMLDWDMVPPYEFHKLQLKMLNAQRSAKRWVLKCPWHIWNLDALMAVYPDAQIIFTHRDISKALASHCSLSAKMASKLRRSLDVKELGEFWLEYTRIGLERAMESRKNIPESQIYDVRLRDLMASPMTVLQDIYSHFDLEFTEEIAGLLKERIEEKPTSQEGEHEYAIEDFGLTNEQVRETLQIYNERFGV
jgi:hypothetical protein